MDLATNPNLSICNIEASTKILFEKLKEIIGDYEDSISKNVEKLQVDLGEMKFLSQKKISCEQEISEAIVKKEKKNELLKSLQLETNQQTTELIGKKRELTVLKKKVQELEKLIKEKSTLLETNQTVYEKARIYLESYSTKLGLHIKHTNHGTLVFVFTQIDRKDPDREYYLELSVDENKYKIHKIVPSVDDQYLLERRLNETNDFSGFLIMLRSLFTKVQ